MSIESTESKDAPVIDVPVAAATAADVDVEKQTSADNVQTLGEKSHYVTGNPKVRRGENQASAAKRQRLLEKKADTWVCFSIINQ